MKTFKTYLEEKTFSIDKDVNFIYRHFFKPFIDKLNKGKCDKLESAAFYSTILKSNEAKMATKLNPVKIVTGTFKDGSFYMPTEHMIQISFNYSAYTLMNMYDGSVINTIRALPPEQIKRFKQEINGSAIKSTIYHELSHWIDDTLHNKHITNTIKKALQVSDRQKQTNILAKGNLDPVASKYEINAQIHAIKKAKTQNKNIWDTITFNDLLTLIPALHSVYNVLLRIDKQNSSNSLEQWRKELKHRMSREGLLGKNMVAYNDNI